MGRFVISGLVNKTDNIGYIFILPKLLTVCHSFDCVGIGNNIDILFVQLGDLLVINFPLLCATFCLLEIPEIVNNQ